MTFVVRVLSVFSGLLREQRTVCFARHARPSGHGAASGLSCFSEGTDMCPVSLCAPAPLPHTQPSQQGNKGIPLTQGNILPVCHRRVRVRIHQPCMLHPGQAAPVFGPGSPNTDQQDAAWAMTPGHPAPISMCRMQVATAGPTRLKGGGLGGSGVLGGDDGRVGGEGF